MSTHVSDDLLKVFVIKCSILRSECLMEDYHYLWFRVSSSDLYIVHMYQMLN